MSKMLVRYGSFVTGLAVLALVPAEHRSWYLYGTTCTLWAMSFVSGHMTVHLTLITAMGIGHSIVHRMYPFLAETVEGFDDSYPALPDVAFHAQMLLFMWLSTRRYISPTMNRYTAVCIVGSFLNCLVSGYKDRADAQYIVFNISSVFQAISTACWIAGCIHYGKWGKRYYAPCLALTTTIIVGNWGVYQYDHWAQLKLGLVAMSMHYRYIEGLFIVCAWIPLACSMLSLPDKSVKQVRFSQS